MFFRSCYKNRYAFENPASKGLFLDGAPEQGASEVTPRANLFTEGLEGKKNVQEWVKNGQTTESAKELARSLQERMEAIKRETQLQLVQEYRFVFDHYVLTPDSYDSKPVTVDQNYKDKGALYVLEKNCPVLAAQFRAYPDLRYLAYASATKDLPDVDVLPMGSTIEMVDGTVYLKRPGKPDASFKLFPWDYRAEIEKKYQELKPKPAEAPAVPPSPADLGAGARTPTFNFGEEDDFEFEQKSPKEEPNAEPKSKNTEPTEPEVEPELYEEGRDANLRTEWEQDVKPALMALEQTYPGVKVRIRDASLTPAKDKPKDEVDRWPNYGKHGKTVELIGEDGHIERFQILVPRKADSYFDDEVTLTRDKDPHVGVTWETVQNGAGLTEFFVQEAEDLFAEEKLSTLLPADIQALAKLPADRQIHYLTDLVLQNAELLSKDPKTWTAQDRTALAQLYNGGLLENMTAWHQELSARTDLTPAMKDNLKSIETHLASFKAHRPNLKAESAPKETPAPAPVKAPEPEKAPSEKASEAYSAYLVAKANGDASTALAHLEEAKKLGSTEPKLQDELDTLHRQFGRVDMRGDAKDCTWQYSPLSTLAPAEAKAYMDFALRTLKATGEFKGMLPLGEYALIKPGFKVSPTFRVKDKLPTQVRW